ncbi:MAG: hypothetical protein AAFP28_06425 [Pseudomonadota bacterium]
MVTYQQPVGFLEELTKRDTLGVIDTRASWVSLDTAEIAVFFLPNPQAVPHTNVLGQYGLAALKLDPEFDGLMKATPLKITNEGGRSVFAVFTFMDNLPDPDPEAANCVLAEAVLGVAVSASDLSTAEYPTLHERIMGCLIE